VPSAALIKMETVARAWSGIDVPYHKKYPIAEQSSVDMLSENTTMVVRLDQPGGLCDPRLGMHHPGRAITEDSP
jgi:hypothetical protein